MVQFLDYHSGIRWRAGGHTGKVMTLTFLTTTPCEKRRCQCRISAMLFGTFVGTWFDDRPKVGFAK